MNKTKTGYKISDNLRWILSISLGMLVLFWRVIIPSNVPITVATGVLILGLDICLTVALIMLNKTQLKESFSKKFTFKTFLQIIVAFIIMYITSIIVFIILATLGLEPSAPAQIIGKEFSKIFPLGAALSMILTAPIWEEISFRMVGKSLIKNKFLFVVITSLLFAFIHTVNFSIVDNIDYFIAGVLFSLCYILTNDIRVSIGAHFLLNLVAVVIGFLIV